MPTVFYLFLCVFNKLTYFCLDNVSINGMNFNQMYFSLCCINIRFLKEVKTFQILDNKVFNFKVIYRGFNKHFVGIRCCLRRQESTVNTQQTLNFKVQHFKAWRRKTLHFNDVNIINNQHNNSQFYGKRSSKRPRLSSQSPRVVLNTVNTI